MTIPERNAIIEINDYLLKTAVVAETDFSAAREIVNESYKSVQQAGDAIRITLVSTVDSILEGLQYCDAFIQRIHHLLDGNHKIMSFSRDVAFNQSFFRLQAFQVETIASDFIRTVARLRSAFSELFNVDVTLSREVFQQEVSLTAWINMIQERMRTLAGEMDFWSSQPFTEEQVLFCRSLYTMESERIVLNWFVQSMPAGTTADLLNSYDRTLDDQHDEAIELF